MKIKSLIIGMTLALTLVGCTTEMRLANRFVTDAHQVRAAVYFPEEARVTLMQDEQGNYTKVLDSLDQNAFLDIMYASCADRLRSYDVDVYVPENSDDIQVDSIHWLVLLTQMEIQGKITSYTDCFYDFVDTYEFQVPLNTVNVAAWFDINDGEWRPTLFYEHNLIEDYHSGVVRKEGEYHYDYSVVEMKTDDLYNYAVYLGRTYADCLFNDMMNKYVRSEMTKQNAVPRFRMRWDPQEKTFYLADEEEGFIELD